MVDKLVIKLNISGDNMQSGMKFTPNMSDPSLKKYTVIYFNPTIAITSKLLKKAQITSDPKVAFSDVNEYLKLMKYVANNKRIPKISLKKATAKGIVDANIEFLRKLYFKRNDLLYINGRAYVVSTSNYKKGSFSKEGNLYNVTFDVRVIDRRKNPKYMDFARDDCKTRGELLRKQLKELTGINIDSKAQDERKPNPSAPVMYTSTHTGVTDGRGPRKILGFPMHSRYNPFAPPQTAYPLPGYQRAKAPQQTAYPQTAYPQTAYPQTAYPQAQGFPMNPNYNPSAPPLPREQRGNVFGLGGSRTRVGGINENPDNRDKYWLVTNNRASVDQFILDEQRPMEMRDFAMTRVMRSDEADGGFWFIQWSRTRDTSRYGHYHLSFIDEEDIEDEEFPPETDIINVNDVAGVKKRTKRHKKKRKQTRKPKKKGKGRTRRRKSRRS